MKRLLRIFLVIMSLTFLFIVAGKVWLVSSPNDLLPAVAALPVETEAPTSHPSTSTAIPSTTSTPTVTATISPTTTYTTTATSTLATLVLMVTSIHSDVKRARPTLETVPFSTSTPLPTVEVPLPPVEIALLPVDNAPEFGWFEVDMAAPDLEYSGEWHTYTSTYRSINRNYVYTDNDNARLSLRFLGSGVRLRYVAFYTYGVFQIHLDGQIVATIDSYFPKNRDQRGNFLSTDIFKLSHGWHHLEIVRLGRKNEASEGTFIGIDAIDIYRSGGAPTAVPTLSATVTPTYTASPAPVNQIVLIAAPPTVRPTATVISPGVTSIHVNLAYDANGNKAADPSEGVQGISVHLMTVDTSEIISTGFTNQDGYVQLQAMTNSPLRLVIPYFNKYWEIPKNSQTMRVAFLIPGANQPGLIP